MKPKAKKTLIIVAAVAAIVAIVWLLFFRKAPAGTAEGYIDRLTGVSAATKRSIKQNLEAAKGQDMAANMAANPGLSYEQCLALAAAYHLVANGTVNDATWQQWKAQIQTM